VERRVHSGRGDGVWNSAVWPKNANTIMIWNDMLSSGRKVTGRGGSDAHHGIPETPEQVTNGSAQAKYNYIGAPTTWIFAPAARIPSTLISIRTFEVSVIGVPVSIVRSRSP
jgi:hypothetical protein